MGPTWIGVVVVLILGAWGISRLGREPGINFAMIEADHPDMVAAVEEAKLNFGQFLGAFRNRADDMGQFAIKTGFSYGDDSYEYMWVELESEVDDKFHGTLGNDPNLVKGMKLGDPVTIPFDQITDWKYLWNGKLVGGYSIKALLKQMPEKKREKFIRMMNFDM